MGFAKRIFEELVEGLPDQGQTLYVDNFYTAYELAESILQRDMHVIGTLRATKKLFPKEAMKASLRRGDGFAKEDENGVVILKWKDVRDIRVLSTKDKPELFEVTRNNF